MGFRMLFKLLDFDRFFARRVAPVAIAVVLTAIASLWMDLSTTNDFASEEAVKDQ